MSKTPRSIAADHACKPLICGIEFNADNLLSKRHYWRLSFSVFFTGATLLSRRPQRITLSVI
jgi:hypothetical protein